MAYAVRLNQFSFAQPSSVLALVIAAFRRLRNLASVRSAAKIRPRSGALIGITVLLAASTPASAANDPLVPAKTPFGYNVGINYETNVDGRTGRSISADLDQITQYFWLVRTYHDTADPNSTTPTISPDENQVIQYALAHPALGLVMGTYNSALVLGNNTTGNFCTSPSGTFRAGLMTTQTYTDAWVQMLIGAFGSASAVAHSVKTILLGNEVDFYNQFIPGPQDPAYSSYLTWIESALSNMKSSLNNAGLGNIPVTVTLAFSPVSDSTQCPGSNTVSTQIPQYISSNWSPSWNGGKAFALYDQYPNPSSPNFGDITGYLQQVVASPAVHNEVFLGETGVQGPAGDDSLEANFYQQMFAFLGSEWRKGGITLPTFPFQAFDYPGLGEPAFGLFSQNASFQPTGLKPGIKIPCWVAQPLTTLAVSHDFNCDGKSDIAWRDSSGNLAIWLMNGSQLLQAGGLGQVDPTIWKIVGQRDFNGDGKADLLWNDTSGNVAIWFMNGLQVSQAASAPSAPGWTVVGTGDFNADGMGDILWEDANRDLAIWLLNGTQVSQAGSLGTLPSGWKVAGTGDFDGDGKADILFENTSGALGIWFMNGVQVAQLGNPPSAPGWTVVGTGDFNGDGYSDILWRDSSNNLAVWLMQGTSILQVGSLGNVGVNWIVAETGDFNGDGKSDILWRDMTAGNVAMWYMNGTAVLQSLSAGSVPLTWTIQGTNAD